MSVDNVEIAKLRMFKAEQLATDLNNWFESDYHRVKDMTDLMRNVSVDSQVASEWRFVLTNISRYGIKEFIKRHPKEANERGFDDETLELVAEDDYHEPWLIEAIRNEFESMIEQQYIKRFSSLDDLTVLASTVIIDKSRYENRWARYSTDQWVDWARTKGFNCTIKGSVKMGKTDLALSLGEMVQKDGADVKTNIMLPKVRLDWAYITRLSTLVKSICQSKLKKKRVLFLLDEAGLFWARIDTIQSVPKDLSKLALCLGKLECNLGFISHFDELVPTIIRRTSVSSFEKRSLTSAFVEIKAGDFRMEPQLVTHIPRTSIEFDPDQLAFFNRDMFVADLLEFVSNIKTGENQWEALIGYVDQHAGESDEALELSPKQVAKWIHKKKKGKYTIRQIADIVEIPKSTVYTWMEEVKQELDSFGEEASVES
jgi:DNA-directed RNA polymerase specialized sigma24 family protein